MILIIKSNENNQKQINDYDIMIVGGGPAGISTWLHLNKYDPDLASRCILIEKEKYPRDKLCGGAVGGWSDNVFKNLDLNINVPSVWIDKVEIQYLDKFFYLNNPRYFRIVKRKEFDYNLVKQAIKRGLQIKENEQFLDFFRNNKHLIVKTSKQEYRIKTLVGADGACSNVRKKIGHYQSQNLAPAIEIFEPANSPFDTEFQEKKVVFDFSPIKLGLQGYVWHFPYLEDNKPYMNHGIGDFRVNKSNKIADMKLIFKNELKKRNINRVINSWSSQPIRWYSKDDILSQSNILLVGDAAGIDPATGGGIHLALSYGDLATQAIISAFKYNNFLYNDYIERFQNHLVGKYIKKLSFIANEMYNQRVNPLDAVKEIFLKN